MLDVYFFKQGRVDAILIGCDGEWMFIDSGFRSDGLECVKKVRDLGVTQIKYYLGSHMHKNHIAGAAPIIDAFRPEMIYANRSEAKATILKYASTKNEKSSINATPITILKPGDKIRLGNADITCYGPLKLKNCSPGAYAENSNSLILRLVYMGRSMLLTGDTTAAILNNVHSKNEGCLKSEVLKNPHHNGALPEATLKKIKPIITVACNASLPSTKYRKLLDKIGSLCYTCCKKGSGNMRVWTDGKAWHVAEKINAK